MKEFVYGTVKQFAMLDEVLSAGMSSISTMALKPKKPMPASGSCWKTGICPLRAWKR